MNEPLNEEHRVLIDMAVEKIERLQKFGDLYTANIGYENEGMSFRKVDLSRILAGLIKVQYAMNTKWCDVCDGAAWIESDDDSDPYAYKCKRCDGTGKIPN